MWEAHLLPSDFAEDLPKGILQQGVPTKPSELLGCNYRLVPLVDLSNMLATLPAGCKMTVVLDACHSVPPNINPTSTPSAAPHSAWSAMEAETAELLMPAPGGGRPVLQPRFLDLPPLATPPTRALSSLPACTCHVYSACKDQQWCAELPIEGCVQGAFTWAFVKALTAGHLETTVQQHGKALNGILVDLRQRLRLLDQTPVVQLTTAAQQHDRVLVP